MQNILRFFLQRVGFCGRLVNVSVTHFVPLFSFVKTYTGPAPALRGGFFLCAVGILLIKSRVLAEFDSEEIFIFCPKKAELS